MLRKASRVDSVAPTQFGLIDAFIVTEHDGGRSAIDAAAVAAADTKVYVSGIAGAGSADGRALHVSGNLVGGRVAGTEFLGTAVRDGGIWRLHLREKKIRIVRRGS